MSETIRLNKFIAHSGFCTRREAADLIKKGKVSVDGTIVDNPGMAVSKANKIIIDGKPLQQFEEAEYHLINKPKGFVCSEKEEGKLVLGLVKESKSKRLKVAHPLSAKGSGLIVVSNDDKLLQRLDKKGGQIKSVYYLKIRNKINRDTADVWEEMLEPFVRYISIINDDFYDLAVEGGGSIEDKLDEYIKSQSNELVRINRNYYAGLTKKDMPRGWTRKLTDKEVIMLKHFT